MSRSRYTIVHLSTVHTSHDNRIYRKECQALWEAGYAVAFMCNAPEDDFGSRVPILSIPSRRSRLARATLGPLAAWRRLRRIRPEVLHIHDPELIPLATLWRWTTGGTAIYDAHEDLPKQVDSKTYLPAAVRPIVRFLAKQLEGTADRYLSAVVCATPSILRNFDHASVALVQNFPWLREYPAASPTEAAPERQTVAYVGVLSRARGSRSLVDGLLGAATGPTLLLAGTVRADAQGDVKRLGTRVIDLGQLPASEVPAVVKRGALGVVVFQPDPNHLEAQPTKLFEYMAAGRPFIASNFPHWRSLVGDGVGLFVDPEEPGQIAAALDSLINDPDSASEMGRRGRALLEEKFTFDRESGALVQLYKSLGAQPSLEAVATSQNSAPSHH